MTSSHISLYSELAGCDYISRFWQGRQNRSGRSAFAGSKLFKIKKSCVLLQTHHLTMVGPHGDHESWHRASNDIMDFLCDVIGLLYHTTVDRKVYQQIQYYRPPTQLIRYLAQMNVTPFNFSNKRILDLPIAKKPAVTSSYRLCAYC